MVSSKFGTDGKGVLSPEALVSSTKLNPIYRGRLKPTKPKQKKKKQEIHGNKGRNRKIKTSGNAAQNPTTSSEGGDKGGGVARGVYCSGREFHAQAREDHVPIGVVQKVDCMVVEESWEAGGDGGAARGVYCPGRGEHASAHEFHTQVRGAHALVRTVLVAD